MQAIDCHIKLEAPSALAGNSGLHCILGIFSTFSYDLNEAIHDELG